MKKAKPYLLALAASLLVTAIVALGALQRPDKWIQDALFQRGGAPDSNIIIIGILGTILMVAYSKVAGQSSGLKKED